MTIVQVGSVQQCQHNLEMSFLPVNPFILHNHLILNLLDYSDCKVAVIIETTKETT